MTGRRRMAAGGRVVPARHGAHLPSTGASMTLADPDTVAHSLAAPGRRFTFCELRLMRFADGKPAENRVGGLHPLMCETWQAPATAPLLRGGGA